MPDQPDPKKPSALGPIMAAIGGNALDTGSTYWALHQPGVREGNPGLPQNPMALSGLKAAATIPEVLGINWLNNSGHPTLAKVAGYAIGGLGAALAAHNISTAKGAK